MNGDDFVYVIADSEGLHKIGVSVAPEKRLAQLQTSHALPLTLVYQLKTNRTLRVERSAHNRLAKHRLSGEWFAVDAETAILAVLAADKRFPPKADPPPFRSARKWFAHQDEIAATRATLAPAPARTRPAVSVSLQLGPTARKPGSLLKKR